MLRQIKRKNESMKSAIQRKFTSHKGRDKNTKPVIFGLAGPSLTDEEREFLTKTPPVGFIFFKRNIQDPEQLRALIADLNRTFHNPPILIDQEGGRVARLTPPHWRAYPPARGSKLETFEEAQKRVRETYTLIAHDLSEIGITHDCAPVLDIDVEGADPIMGDRTFSKESTLVAALGGIAIKALQEGGITPIMKHLPGHGAAKCDSHQELPVVDLSLEELTPHFAPFKENASCPWAMTAHVVYSAIDPVFSATHSRRLIQEIIRGDIGFKGTLISDDIGMGALSGSLAERARLALEAGCDLVLECSGEMRNMKEVMEGI